jgi:hypothetical protein
MLIFFDRTSQVFRKSLPPTLLKADKSFMTGSHNLFRNVPPWLSRDFLCIGHPYDSKDGFVDLINKTMI